MVPIMLTSFRHQPKFRREAAAKFDFYRTQMDDKMQQMIFEMDSSDLDIKKNTEKTGSIKRNTIGDGDRPEISQTSL